MSGWVMQLKKSWQPFITIISADTMTVILMKRCCYLVIHFATFARPYTIFAAYVSGVIDSCADSLRDFPYKFSHIAVKAEILLLNLLFWLIYTGGRRECEKWEKKLIEEIVENSCIVLFFIDILKSFSDENVNE